MTEASRVQKMLNEQNAWIDKLKSQVMRLKLDVVGYRTRNKQLEAALRDCMEMAEVHEIPFRDRVMYISDVARKALEGKDD